MREQDPNCPYGPDSDVDARYLAGLLSDEESDAFEQHYFHCDRCFAAVKRGTEIRAASSSALSEAPAAASPRSIPVRSPRRRFSLWQPALAAAGVAIFALGIRQVAGRRAANEETAVPPRVDAPRGATPVFTLSSHATSTVLAAAWSPLKTAHSYRVRLVASDGSLLFERETADTAIVLSRDIVRDKTPVYWEVQALDALRSVLATSPVVQAQTAPSPP
jgi:hypothetical protein